MKAIGYFLGACAFGICAIMCIGITAIVLRAIFGKPETWHHSVGDMPQSLEDVIGYDDNDPGVDVDA